MPHLTLQMSPGGPILDFLVGVSVPREDALRRHPLKIAQPVQVRGLIDTGASATCVDPDCLARLDITPTGRIPIHTPSTGSTPHTTDQYDVSLILLHPDLHLQLQVLPVISSSLGLQGIQALIGRDVLAQCLFVFDGTARIFSLAF